MPFVNVGKEGDPCEVYYELHGGTRAKFNVLFVMGFSCPYQCWKYQVEYFAGNPEFAVCIFGKKTLFPETVANILRRTDNRGIGKSKYMGLSMSTKVFARDAKRLVDHLGWSQFHLVGLSMGGMIATELAYHIPSRVITLSLCVTHAGGLTSLTPTTGAGYIVGYGRAASQRDRGRVLKALARLNFSEAFLNESRSNYQFAVEFCRHWFVPVHPFVLGGQLKAILSHYASYSRLAVLKNDGIPVLVMTGTDDKLVRPINSAILAKALNAKLVQFRAGHMIQAEVPELFNLTLQLHITAPRPPRAPRSAL